MKNLIRRLILRYLTKQRGEDIAHKIKGYHDAWKKSLPENKRKVLKKLG